MLFIASRPSSKQGYNGFTLAFWWVLRRIVLPMRRIRSLKFPASHLALIAQHAREERRVPLAVFYLLFTVVGFLLAVFVAIGWLPLLTTIRRLLVSDWFPGGYLAAARVFAGEEFAASEADRLAASRPTPWKTYLGLQPLIMLVLSFILLWKFDISLLEIVRLLLN
jgi:hypothetical protein